MSPAREEGIFIEYVRLPQSNSLKVTAIDPHTGMEAVVIVPAKTEPKAAAQFALQKLRYILQKK